MNGTVPTPPEGFRQLVSGCPDVESFNQAGLGVIYYCKGAGLLEDGARFLDVGCGCGRVARHLIDQPIQSYTGFDRHGPMVDWAQREIAERDARFRFDHFAVASNYDRFDGEAGVTDLRTFRWPYDDNAFDSVLLASVFSHMAEDEIGAYMRQIYRVLAPGGLILASFLLKHHTAMDGFNWLYRASEIEAMFAGNGFMPTFIEDCGQGWWVAKTMKSQRCLAIAAE